MISTDISIADYHASEFVSNSKIAVFARQGALAYYDRYVSRTEPAPAPSAAMVFGQAFEDLVQTPDLWPDLYTVKPAVLKMTTKEGKAWRDAQTRVVIDQDDHDAMVRMGEAIAQNRSARELTCAAQTQATVRGAFPGLPGLQARPDWYSAGGSAVSEWRPYVADLKTTSRFEALASGRGVYDYRYHVQAAIACHLLAEECGHRPTAYLIACETVAPYRCQVIEMSQSWIQLGWRTANRDLAALGECYRTGVWPRVEREIVTLGDVPRWMEEQT